MIRNFAKLINRLVNFKGARIYIVLVSGIFAHICIYVLNVKVPSILVSMLSDNLSFVYFSVLLLLLVLFSIIEPLFAMKMSKELFMFRLNEVSQLNLKSIDLPVASVEIADGKEQVFNAQKAVSYGNNQGIEAYLYAGINLIKGTFVLLVYTYLMKEINVAIIIFLYAFSLLRVFLEKNLIKNTIHETKNISSTLNQSTRIKHSCVDYEAAKDIRLFNFKNIIEEKLSLLNQKYNEFIKKRELNRLKGETLQSIISWARNIIFIAYILRFSNEQIDIPAFVLYMGILLNVDSILGHVQTNFNAIKTNQHYIEDFLDFFETTPFNVKKDINEKVGSFERLEVINLKFSYEFDKKYQINDVSLSINKNQRIALVGENGSGKTTLIKCITGLYPPSAGQININGKDIGILNSTNLNGIIASEFQEPFILANSIAENIACVRKDEINIEKVNEVIEACGLKTVIDELPNGVYTNMTTWIDPKGIELSGGQTQRLMMARVLYKESDLIILDEPSAALDPKAEAELYQWIDKNFINKTVMFVSHRLSSTQLCDKIYVMKDGKIVESGNHHDLIKKSGVYANLFKVQSEQYREVVL